MEITTDAPEWTSENKDILRQFLQSETGKRLLPKILESAPALLAGGELNAILIRSGEFRGFSSAVQTLLSLTASDAPHVESTPASYPPLEKDEAWNDGETLAKE